MDKAQLNKEDELILLKFTNYDEAKRFFEEKYNNDFVFIHSLDLDGEKVSVYSVILGHEKYHEDNQSTSDYSTKENTISYRITIWEDGNVRVGKLI